MLLDLVFEINMSIKKTAWVIIDKKVGNANQAIAIAKALKIKYLIKEIKYSCLTFLPNWLKFNSLIGIDLKRSSDLAAPFPDILISSGRRVAAVSNYIKKKSPGVFSIHLMNPDMNFNNFDVVCLPLHDLKSKYQKYNNIIYSIGAPSFLDSELIDISVEKFQSKKNNLNPPFISIIIGGKTKQDDYKLEELIELLVRADELAKTINASLLISTSRRTNPKFTLDKLLNKIASPYYFFDYHQQKGQENPYLAFLKLADYFIITGDSVSSCSEALSTGKPVYIYYQERLLSNKHQAFINHLKQNKLIKFINDNTFILEKWDYLPLDEAKRMAKLIEEKLQC